MRKIILLSIILLLFLTFGYASNLNQCHKIEDKLLSLEEKFWNEGWSEKDYDLHNRLANQYQRFCFEP